MEGSTKTMNKLVIVSKLFILELCDPNFVTCK